MVTLSKETGTEKSIQMWKTLHISLSSCRSSQSDLQQSDCAEKLFELCWLMPWQTKFALISFVIMIVEMWSWWCWESWRSSFGGRLQFCSLWLSLGVTKVVKKGFGMFKVAATQQLIHCWWMLIIIVSKESIKGSFGFVRKEMVHLVSDARGCEKKWECRSTCSRACDEFEVGCCVSSASRLLVHPCVNLSFRNIFVWSVERFTWNLWRWAVARFKGWNQNWMARAIREIDACSVKQLGKQFSSDFASADFQSNFRTISVAISPWFAHACWWTVGTAFTVFFTNCLFQLQFFVFFYIWFLVFDISHSRHLTLGTFPHLSAGQLCDLRTRPAHVASRMAVHGWNTVADDATALGWSQEAHSTRAHSFDISHHAQSDWIGLHCITPRLPLNHDQPRFAVWQVMSPSALLMGSLITLGDLLSKAQRQQWRQHC